MANIGGLYRVYYDDHDTGEFDSGGLVNLCECCEDVFEDTRSSKDTDVSVEYWEDIDVSENAICAVCGSKLKS